MKLHGTDPHVDVAPAAVETVIVCEPSGAFGAIEIAKATLLSFPLAALTTIPGPLKDKVAPVRFVPLTVMLIIEPGPAPPGMNEFIFGGALGKTLKVTDWEAVPVSELKTRMLMEPGLANAESGNRHRRVVALTKVVGTLCEFTRTREPLLKPLPDSVMVKEVVPAGTLPGETVFKTGASDCRLRTEPADKATIRMKRVKLNFLRQHYDMVSRPFREAPGKCTTIVSIEV
jgi:hypothetical protein